MKKVSFQEAVAQIMREDSRFPPEAYLFVLESLDFTTRMLSKPASGPKRHVAGAELLEGMRQFALKEYGPVAMTVLNSWGIHRCDDFGQIVFNLVNKKILGKTDSDSVHDFENRFDFETAFKKPFEPEPETKKRNVIRDTF